MNLQPFPEILTILKFRNMSWPSCCRWKVAKVSTQKVDFFVWNIPAVLRDDAIVVWLEWLCFFFFLSRFPWNLEVSFDFRMMDKYAKQIEGGVEKRRLLSSWHPQNPRNWHPESPWALGDYASKIVSLKKVGMRRMPPSNNRMPWDATNCPGRTGSNQD